MPVPGSDRTLKTSAEARGDMVPFFPVRGAPVPCPTVRQRTKGQFHFRATLVSGGARGSHERLGRCGEIVAVTAARLS